MCVEGVFDILPDGMMDDIILKWRQLRIKLKLRDSLNADETHEIEPELVSLINEIELRTGHLIKLDNEITLPGDQAKAAFEKDEPLLKAQNTTNKLILLHSIQFA